MHHKKGRRQRNARAGCKLCKPWKASGVPIESPVREKWSDHRRRHFADQDVRARRGLELLAYLAMVRQHDRGIAHVGKSTGHGFDRQRVAGLNGEAWGDFCVEVAPVHGGRVGERACDESACLPLALHGWSPVARLAARLHHFRSRHTEMLIEHSRLLCQPCGRALENESTGREHINIIRYRQS